MAGRVTVTWTDAAGAASPRVLNTFADVHGKRLVIGDDLGVVDVRSYGDLDPTGAIDASAVFQLAINAASDTLIAGAYGLDYKPTVQIPRGKYRLSTGLVVQPRRSGTGTDRVSFRGAGMHSSHFYPDAGITALTLKCGEGGLDGITLEKFGVVGGANGISIPDTGGFTAGFFRNVLRDLLFTGQSVAGITSSSGEIIETLFENIIADTAQYGGYFNNAAFNLNTLIQCRWRLCTEAGLYIANADGCRSTGGLYESNGKHGLILEHPFSIVLDDWFEHNGTNAVGGPYAHVRLQATAINAGGVHFGSTQWTCSGANDGSLAVQVTTDHVNGPLVFDDCNMHKGSGTQGNIDVGAFATVPIVSFPNVNNMNKYVGTVPNFTNPPTAAWLSPRTGRFTMTATASMTVFDSTLNTSAVVVLGEENAAAATLQSGPARLYIGARPAGVGFEVKTANGASAAGTETFTYMILR